MLRPASKSWNALFEDEIHALGKRRNKDNREHESKKRVEGVGESPTVNSFPEFASNILVA